MKENHRGNAFERFYVWVTESKMTMGLFFAAYVFFYLFLGFFADEAPAQIDFSTSLEMMVAAFLLGILQKLLVPGRSGKITPPRSIAWVALSTLATLGFSLAFGWFAGYPAWCLALFVGAVALGVSLMVYFYYLQLKAETRRLNERLARFQSQAAGEV